jgi:acetyltransferase EpsM
MPTSFLIYGAGGHANVLADLGMLTGAEVPVMFSDDAAHHGSRNNTIIRSYDPLLFPELPLVLGIGNNNVREILAEQVAHSFTGLLHRTSYVAADVAMGEGSVVLANAVVQANSRIGNHVIINAGAVIDHDAVIGDFVHVSANAYIGGGAVIEKGAVIGPGAIILRNAVIKQGVVIPPLTIVAA